MAWSHGDPARRGHIERLAGVHHGQYGSGVNAVLAGQWARWRSHVDDNVIRGIEGRGWLGRRLGNDTNNRHHFHSLNMGGPASRSRSRPSWLRPRTWGGLCHVGGGRLGRRWGSRSKRRLSGPGRGRLGSSWSLCPAGIGCSRRSGRGCPVRCWGAWGLVCGRWRSTVLGRRGSIVLLLFVPPPGRVLSGPFGQGPGPGWRRACLEEVLGQGGRRAAEDDGRHHNAGAFEQLDADVPPALDGLGGDLPKVRDLGVGRGAVPDIVAVVLEAGAVDLVLLALAGARDLARARHGDLVVDDVREDLDLALERVAAFDALDLAQGFIADAFREWFRGGAGFFAGEPLLRQPRSGRRRRGHLYPDAGGRWPGAEAEVGAGQ
jgi:hypothetical protein